MKKLIFAVALVMSFSFAASAQNAQPKVIALLTEASWCPICQANGPRFMKDVMPKVMMNKEVKMVMNDVSNDKTKASSKPMLEEIGIYNFAENNPGTGVLYFIDAKTKELLSKVSLAQTNEEIEKAYQEALSKA
jgi:hypothetical protein